MTRAKIIETAKAQVGNGETPPNSNKTLYGQWYGLDGVAWCAIFVSWVYDKAGHPLGKVDSAKGYHYCPSAFNHWKATNEVTTNPEQGDIVLFDWNGDRMSDHTGIFDKWEDDTKKFFYSYEGNTSTVDDSNGGMVMYRKRSAGLVQAFVKPAVLKGNAPAVVPPTVNIKRGDRNADVTYLQNLLYDCGFDITVDGDFGAQTEKFVKQFQKENNLEVTGIATPAVIGAMEHILHAPEVSEKKITTGVYLQEGDSGVAVVALQKALNKKRATPKLTEDGVFGAGTKKAVKEFQKSNSLGADGIAGPKTLGALGIK